MESESEAGRPFLTGQKPVLNPPLLAWFESESRKWAEVRNFRAHQIQVRLPSKTSQINISVLYSPI